MEHDGDRGSTALYVASQNGHAKCVEGKQLLYPSFQTSQLLLQY